MFSSICSVVLVHDGSLLYVLLHHPAQQDEFL